MRTVKGPATFLALAAESRSYCDEVRGVPKQAGLTLTELSTHLQGQLVAVHPAYDLAFDGFAAPEVRGNPAARQAWAVEQMHLAARASANLGLTAHATFSGALAWPYLYPWPQRPAGLIEAAFDELAKCWTPILDAFDAAGVDVAFEIHLGEDLHDGATFEMFLGRVRHHPRCNILYDPSHFLLQQLDYLAFIDLYHERIRLSHAKDAELRASGRQGVYSGYQPWAVLEWECCIKDSEQGAAEGAAFIRRHIINVSARAFDDFTASGVDMAANRKLLGLA